MENSYSNGKRLSDDEVRQIILNNIDIFIDIFNDEHSTEQDYNDFKNM